MGVQAQSDLAILLDTLAQTVAAAPALLQRAGVASSAAALERIHLEIFDGSGLPVDARPFACIVENEEHWKATAEGDGIFLECDGVLHLLLSDNARHRESYRDSKLDFVNFSAGVIDFLRRNSGKGDYFPAQAIRLTQRAVRTPRDERQDDNDYWWVVYAIGYGTGGGA